MFSSTIPMLLLLSRKQRHNLPPTMDTLMLLLPGAASGRTYSPFSFSCRYTPRRSMCAAVCGLCHSRVFRFRTGKQFMLSAFSKSKAQKLPLPQHSSPSYLRNALEPLAFPSPASACGASATAPVIRAASRYRAPATPACHHRNALPAALPETQPP